MADEIQILRTYKVFWKLLRENTPILYQNLKDTDATCHMFLQPWIITLFSNSFEIETCAVLWDQIFLYGQNHILRIALAICQITERRFRHEMVPKDPSDFDDFDADALGASAKKKKQNVPDDPWNDDESKRRRKQAMLSKKKKKQNVLARRYKK